MTKRQLIDEIVTLNHTAEPGFLSRFQDEDLRDYLDHLQTARAPRLTGDSARYEKYFATAGHVPPAEFGLGEPAVSTETDAAERAALLGATPPAEGGAEMGERETPAQPTSPALVEAAAPAPVAPADEQIKTEKPEAHADAPQAQADVAQADEGDAASPADIIEALQTDAEHPQVEEAICDPIDDDPADDEPAESGFAEDDPAEEATTRHDTVTARIARAWRQAPPHEGDDSAGAGVDSREKADPVADGADVPAEEDSTSPTDAGDEKPAKTDEPAPALVGRSSKEEDSQDWLF